MEIIKTYKYCIVPSCKSTTKSTPSKIFFLVPKHKDIRKKWCKVMNRDERSHYPELSATSPLYCCENHFNLEEDTQNFIQYQIMTIQEGKRVTLRLKKGILPHKFYNQMEKPTLDGQISRMSLDQIETEESTEAVVKEEPYNLEHSQYSTNIEQLLYSNIDFETEDVLDDDLHLHVKYELNEDTKLPVVVKNELETDRIITQEDISIKQEADESDESTEISWNSKLSRDGRASKSSTTGYKSTDLNLRLERHEDGVGEKEPRFSCNTCNFQTKRRDYLTIHEQSHLPEHQAVIYSCTECCFKTKLKPSLKRHMACHDLSQVFSCEHCSYSSHVRRHLQRHLLRHRNLGQFKGNDNLLTCNKCEFKTKFQPSLSRHMLRHKDAKDVKMFTCEECHYQANRKSNLEIHIQIHRKYKAKRNFSEVGVDKKKFKCEICDYEVPFKQSLKVHTKLMHMDAEVNVFTCSKCNLQTKSRRGFYTHRTKMNCW